MSIVIVRALPPRQRALTLNNVLKMNIKRNYSEALCVTYS